MQEQYTEEDRREHMRLLKQTAEAAENGAPLPDLVGSVAEFSEAYDALPVGGLMLAHPYKTAGKKNDFTFVTIRCDAGLRHFALFKADAERDAAKAKG